MYGQGKSWDTCQPAGFLSKKFTSAQHNYHMHEHETLAVLEALMKWEDKLLGRKFTVVTDDKVLNTSRHSQTCCQGRQGGGNTFPAFLMILSM